MWQLRQPAAQQSIDLLRPQLVADGLQPIVVLAGNESVIQRLEADPLFAELAFGVFVSVQAQLRIIREVRTELQEEGTELPVQTVTVEVVHHRRRAHDPGIGMSRLRIAALLGAEHWRLFLRLADEDDPFRFIETRQVFLHHIILALALVELHQRNLLLFREMLHRRHEGFGHGVHQGRRGEFVAAVTAEKLGDSAFALQHRHVDIEIHPVDALQLESHMVIEDIGDALWYAHFGSGTTPVLRDRLPPRRLNSSAGTARSSSPSTGAISRIIPYAAHAARYISSV